MNVSEESLNNAETASHPDDVPRQPIGADNGSLLLFIALFVCCIMMMLLNFYYTHITLKHERRQITEPLINFTLKMCQMCPELQFFKVVHFLSNRHKLPLWLDRGPVGGMPRMVCVLA